MKIIIVGATGTLGKKVSFAFSQNHEIIRVGRRQILQMKNPLRQCLIRSETLMH